MARYEMNIKCSIDTEYPLIGHDDIVYNIITNCCPGEMGLCYDNCKLNKMTQSEVNRTCFDCWKHAFEGGVKRDAQDIVSIKRVGQS